jgi:hypothetical protein
VSDCASSSRRRFLREIGTGLASLALSPVARRQDGERILRPSAAPGPLDNPLKGWCTYTHAGEIRQPYSMVFRYVAWRDLEPGEGDYRFAEWEARSWNEAAARDKHVVLRVYADYPSRPSGVPAWLLAKGVKTTRYTDHGGGLSPDYNHPETVAGLERLIAAMGRRYAQNPRVAFLQLGLLGFWGEWHTWPRSELFASEATQKRVIDAYRAAFPQKILLARTAGGPAGRQAWLGYHDDMFPEDTDGPEGWEFLPRMRRSGRTENWKRAAIGGEMVPNAAKKWLGEGFDRTMQMVERAHVSWIGPYNPALERNPTPEFLARSQQMVRRMGYEYVLREVRWPESVTTGGPLPIRITGRNQGVAPFYYPWPVELALLQGTHTQLAALPMTAVKGTPLATLPPTGVDGTPLATLPPTAVQPVVTLPLAVDLRTWLPGPFRVTAAPAVPAPPGRYTLAIGIRDPWTRRPAIGFANDLPRHEGWTLLGDITVTRS